MATQGAVACTALGAAAARQQLGCSTSGRPAAAPTSPVPAGCLRTARRPVSCCGSMHLQNSRVCLTAQLTCVCSQRLLGATVQPLYLLPLSSQLARPATQPWLAAQHVAAPWQQRQRPPAAAGRPGRRPPALSVVCEAAAGQHTPPPHADYQAKAGDSAVLQRPLKSELLPEEIHNVFGYPRNLKEK